MSKSGKGHFCGPMDSRKGRKSFPIPDCCLTGDTKIKLLDGTEEPIGDLVGQSGFWVYGYDVVQKAIVPTQVSKVWMAIENAPIYRVTLDDDSVVECTGNHPFLLRDGTYCRADELRPGAALMPLYTMLSKNRDGFGAYEKVYQPWYNFWEYTHHMVARESQNRCIQRNEHVHHKNGRKRDNCPGNLEFLDRLEHLKEHFTPGSRGNFVWQQFSKVCDEKVAHIAPITAPRIRSKRTFDWTNPRTEIPGTGIALSDVAVLISEGVPRKRVARALNVNDRTLIDWLSAAGLNSASPEPRRGGMYRQALLAQFSDVFGASLEDIHRSLMAGEDYETIQAIWHVDRDTIRTWFKRVDLESPTHADASRASFHTTATNHAVVSVERVGVSDAYDMEVPSTSNFALAAGVFVHNSHVTAGLRLIGRYTGPGSKAKIRACIMRRASALGCPVSDAVEVETIVPVTERLQMVTDERDRLKSQLTDEGVMAHPLVNQKMAELSTLLDETKSRLATLQAAHDGLDLQLKAMPSEHSALSILERENTTLYLVLHHLRAERLVDLQIRLGHHPDVIASSDPATIRASKIQTAVDDHDSAELATAYTELAKSSLYGLAVRPKTPSAAVTPPGLDRGPTPKASAHKTRPETRQDRATRLILQTPSPTQVGA